MEDIIFELVGQVKPLEKQAATAKRYLELDKERKQTQLNLLVHDIEVGKSDLTKAEKDLAEVKEKLARKIKYYRELALGFGRIICQEFAWWQDA